MERRATLARRTALVGAGGSVGALLGGGLTQALRRGPSTLPPGPSSHADVLRALAATLTPLQRRLLVLPADHPSRQIANTIAVLDRPHLGTLLSAAQVELVERLYHSMLTERGRDALAATVAVEGRLDGCVLAIYGDPERGDAHTVISGGHLLVRGGGDPGEGSVFGGAVAYGHQAGHRRWRVPGNSFAYHGDAANRLFATLSAEQRAQAVLPVPPHELLLQVQDGRGRFPGLACRGLSGASKEAAAELLGAVLGLYPQAARARSAIDDKGGLAALHIAYFANKGFYRDMKAWGSLDPGERARRGDPYWQVWRLEGPGTVLHFGGHPHVHAYVQVARDPRRTNVGETLGETTETIEGPSMRDFIEGALRRATGEALAFAAADPLGRFCPGEITTGLAYAVDAYRETLAVAVIDGRAMTPGARERLGLTAEGRHRVATTPYLASDRQTFGEPDEVIDMGVPLRDALIAHVRGGGLRSAGARPG